MVIVSLQEIVELDLDHILYDSNNDIQKQTKSWTDYILNVINVSKPLTDVSSNVMLRQEAREQGIKPDELEKIIDYAMQEMGLDEIDEAIGLPTVAVLAIGAALAARIGFMKDAKLQKLINTTKQGAKTLAKELPIIGKKIKDKANLIILFLCIIVFFLASRGFSILYLFLLADLLCCAAVVTIFYGFFKKKINYKLSYQSIIFGLLSGLLFFPSTDFQSSILVGNLLSKNMFNPLVVSNLLFISFVVSIIIPTIILLIYSLRNSFK